MNESDVINLVRSIIRQELAHTLLGRTVTTDDTGRGTARRFQNSDNPFDTRIISPYGLYSRPKVGMASLITPLNADPTHQVQHGQFDENRPAIQQDEVVLYGPTGKVVYMKADSTIHMGSLTSAQQAVLGNVLATALTSIINRFLLAPNIGESAAGEVFLAPDIRTGLTEDLQTYVTTADTNILAQKIYVERGNS